MFDLIDKFWEVCVVEDDKEIRASCSNGDAALCCMYAAWLGDISLSSDGTFGNVGKLRKGGARIRLSFSGNQSLGAKRGKISHDVAQFITHPYPEFQCPLPPQQIGICKNNTSQ
jgi:hypothetical protein